MSDKDWADKAAEKIESERAGFPCDKCGHIVPVSMADFMTHEALASLIRSHTAPRELVGEPEAWIIEHSFTDRNGDGADAQLFGMREEAEEKRQDLIILWLDEQPENVTEAPDDLYPIIPLYRSALTAHEPKVCEWGFRKFNSTLDPNIYINCKHEPIVAMYYDLSAKPYCPYCGGVIKVKES